MKAPQFPIRKASSPAELLRQAGVCSADPPAEKRGRCQQQAPSRHDFMGHIQNPE